MLSLAALRAKAETLARQLPSLIGAVSAYTLTATSEPMQTEPDCLTKTFLAFSSLAERWEEGERNFDESFEHDLLYHEVRLSLCHAEAVFDETGQTGSVFDMKSELENRPGATSLIERYQSSDGRKLAFEDSRNCVSKEDHNKCVEAISK